MQRDTQTISDPANPMRQRAWVSGLIAAYVILQVLIPLGYYIWRTNPDNERFAWRMFSAIRVRQCHVASEGYRRDGEHLERIDLPLTSSLHTAWVDHLKRNRTRVAHAYLDWQCEQPLMENISLLRRCKAIDDRVGKGWRISMQCANRSIHVQEMP